MRRASGSGGSLIPMFMVCFAAGTIIGWWLRGGAPQPAATNTAAIRAETAETTTQSVPDAPPSVRAPSPATANEPTISPAIQPVASAVDELARRGLRIPIDDANVDRWKGMFAEDRDVNARQHEAVDILAPRNTPVHAVEDGTIASLFYSKAGGNTVYEFDPDQRFCYYYAHLERYAPGLEKGQRITRGDIIGYVGTSGNAPANTPHLHFAIFALDSDRRWWQGRPLDPFLVFQPAQQR